MIPLHHHHGKHYYLMLKVSKFQNEFMKSSFLPKYEPNILKISALYRAALQGRNPYNFLVRNLGETITS